MRRRSLLVGALALLVCGAGAALLLGKITPNAGGGLPSTWSMVVPDGYRGVLEIRFSCPRGHPLTRQGRLVTRFAADGTDCVSDASPTWGGQYRVARASGTAIPTDNADRLPSHADAFTGGSTELIGGGTSENPGSDITYSWYYVGPAVCIPAVERRSSADPWCKFQDPSSLALRKWST